MQLKLDVVAAASFAVEHGRKLCVGSTMALCHGAPDFGKSCLPEFGVSFPAPFQQKPILGTGDLGSLPQNKSKSLRRI